MSYNYYIIIIALFFNPKFVCRTTVEQLIDAYEQKYEVLMTSDTLSQFKKRFPGSSEQAIVTVKLHSQYMKHKTLDDLQMLMQKMVYTDGTLEHFATIELQPTCCVLTTLFH